MDKNKKKDLIIFWKRAKQRFEERSGLDSPFKRRYKPLTLLDYTMIK